MKAEVDKLDINKLINVPTSSKLKTVPLDLRNLMDVVDNEVVQNTKFNTQKVKVNNLEKKTPDAVTLIRTSFNTTQINKI